MQLPEIVRLGDTRWRDLDERLQPDNRDPSPSRNIVGSAQVADDGIRGEVGPAPGIDSPGNPRPKNGPAPKSLRQELPEFRHAGRFHSRDPVQQRGLGRVAPLARPSMVWRSQGVIDLMRREPDGRTGDIPRTGKWKKQKKNAKSPDVPNGVCVSLPTRLCEIRNESDTVSLMFASHLSIIARRESLRPLLCGRPTPTVSETHERSKCGRPGRDPRLRKQHGWDNFPRRSGFAVTISSSPHPAPPPPKKKND